MKKADVYIWCFGAALCFFLLHSCQVEEPLPEEISDDTSYSEKRSYNHKNSFFNKAEPDTYILSQMYFDDGIISSPCPVTDFNKIISGHFETLFNDPLFDFELINYLSDLNRRYVSFYEGENYYGENT